EIVQQAARRHALRPGVRPQEILPFTRRLIDERGFAAVVIHQMRPQRTAGCIVDPWHDRLDGYRHGIALQPGRRPDLRLDDLVALRAPGNYHRSLAVAVEGGPGTVARQRRRPLAILPPAVLRRRGGAWRPRHAGNLDDSVEEGGVLQDAEQRAGRDLYGGRRQLRHVHRVHVGYPTGSRCGKRHPSAAGAGGWPADREL